MLPPGSKDWASWKILSLFVWFRTGAAEAEAHTGRERRRARPERTGEASGACVAAILLLIEPRCMFVKVVMLVFFSTNSLIYKF
jgi:hypothetical protein